MVFWGLTVLIIIYTVMAVIHLSGHGSWMIPGYSGLNANEKEKYNKKKIAKIESIKCLLMDIGFIISAVTYNSQSEITLKVVPWVIVVILFISIAWSVSSRIIYRSKTLD